MAALSLPPEIHVESELRTATEMAPSELHVTEMVGLRGLMRTAPPSPSVYPCSSMTARFLWRGCMVRDVF